MSTNSSKTLTGGSGVSDSAQKQPTRRRRTKLTLEKKIADDEFMAAAIGDVKWLTQSLKDSGPDINFDKDGLSAIHLAAIHGRLDCLKVCIEKFKIDVNLPSSTGWRAIHLCINNLKGKQSLQCLQYLLEKGADNSVTNDDGVTPVHQAASEGHVQCLKLLLEVGAKVDGKDCRGNTPLDLAKLWGHRKCARILAAETWHQDQDSVAKEMHQLKKLKMQQVLKELEEEEEMKAARQFYGDEGFKQWMTSKSLAATLEATHKEKENITESLHKPNSVLTDYAKNGTTKIKLSMDARKMTDRSTKYDTVTKEITMKDLLMTQVISNADADNPRDKKLEKMKKTSVLQHDAVWNKFTKAPKNPYKPNLKDYFPRDKYTMMPHVKGLPKYYEGKFIKPITSDNIDEDVKQKGSKVKLRKPHLPEEVINSFLSHDSSISKRGMIFKCKHIEDVHRKKKYDNDQAGYSEAPLHLTNDIHSLLVKNNIRTLKNIQKISTSK